MEKSGEDIDVKAEGVAHTHKKVLVRVSESSFC